MDGLDEEEEAEIENPRKGVFFKEEEEKGSGEGEVRKREDEEHWIAIFGENGFLVASFWPLLSL